MEIESREEFKSPEEAAAAKEFEIEQIKQKILEKSQTWDKDFEKYNTNNKKEYKKYLLQSALHNELEDLYFDLAEKEGRNFDFRKDQEKLNTLINQWAKEKIERGEEINKYNARWHLRSVAESYVRKQKEMEEDRAKRIEEKGQFSEKDIEFWRHVYLKPVLTIGKFMDPSTMKPEFAVIFSKESMEFISSGKIIR